MQTQPTTTSATSARDRFRVDVEDAATFSTRRIGRLRHNFHEHPLMQLPELERLAKELMPIDGCRFIRPGLDQGSKFDIGPKPTDGRTIDEVFRQLEEPASWIALYNVERIPRYEALLTEALATVRPFVERDQSGIFLITGFIFISAPPSVTPFHIDRENNFWLQIRGRKVMNVWDHTDRVVVPARDVEEFIVNHAMDSIRLKDAFRPRSHEFDVGPGDGVYFPSTSPHMTRSDRDWVKPGDGISVSIGVNFYTPLTRTHARVHQFNEAIRRFGVNPTSPGVSIVKDLIKAPVGRVLGAARALRRGEKLAPGSY